MPIKPIALQRRHAELGRIRLGQKVATGDGKTRPDKLDRFRFTSPNERHITDLATLYGGQARPWDNNGRSEFEVISEARAIPVIVVKGGLSQWFETWSGGGCQRRCDGEYEVKSQDRPIPCICDAENRPERLCKPTTRLSVMLRDLDAIGVWRLESKGWNSAAELPGVADLAQYVGDLVPANLTLHERIAIRDGRTSRFVVPGLDLEIAPARLAALVSGQQTGAAAIEAPRAAAIEAPRAAAIEAPRPDYAAEAAQLGTVEDVRELWKVADSRGHLNDAVKTALVQRVEDLKAHDPAPPADVQAEVNAAHAAGQAAEPDWVSGGQPEGDVDGLWLQCVAEGGRQGMTTDALKDAYAQHSGGLLVDDADAVQLAEFLAALKSGQVAA